MKYIAMVVWLLTVSSALAVEPKWVKPAQGRFFRYDANSVRRTSDGYSAAVEVFVTNGTRMFLASRQTWEIDCSARRGRELGYALMHNSSGGGIPDRIPSTELWSDIGRDELGTDWMLSPLYNALCSRTVPLVQGH
jgi:hypothetical protein